jgi:hypothetical protein
MTIIKVWYAFGFSNKLLLLISVAGSDKLNSLIPLATPGNIGTWIIGMAYQPASFPQKAFSF